MNAAAVGSATSWLIVAAASAAAGSAPATRCWCRRSITMTDGGVRDRRERGDHAGGTERGEGVGETEQRTALDDLGVGDAARRQHDDDRQAFEALEVVDVERRRRPRAVTRTSGCRGGTCRGRRCARARPPTAGRCTLPRWLPAPTAPPGRRSGTARCSTSMSAKSRPGPATNPASMPSSSVDRRDRSVRSACPHALTDELTATARPLSGGSSPHGTSWSTAVGTMTTGSRDSATIGGRTISASSSANA